MKQGFSVRCHDVLLTETAYREAKEKADEKERYMKVGSH